MAAPTSGPTGTTTEPYGLFSDNYGKVTATFAGNNIPGPFNVVASIPFSTSTVQVPLTNVQYTFTLLTPSATTALLGQVFPRVNFTIGGGAVSFVNFSTPASTTLPSGNFSGYFKSSSDAAVGFNMPPLRANQVAGAWLLRVSLSPQIYQDFTFNNVAGHITPTATVTTQYTSVDVNKPVTLKAFVNSAIATGIVTINDSGGPIGACTLAPQGSAGTGCQINFSFGVAGTHSLSAYYGGDANHYATLASPITKITVYDPSTFNFNNITVINQQPDNPGRVGNNCYGSLGSGTYLSLWSTNCNLGRGNGDSGGSGSNSAPNRAYVSEARPSRALPKAAPALPPQTQYPIGQGPHSLASADFNGDGRADVVVTNQADGTASVLLGLSTGGLQQAVTYPAGANPTVIVTGDFNHDGHTDWAVANSAGTVSVALGFGDGTFALPIAFQATGSIALMAAGDLNGDGVTDLVTLDSTTGTIYVYLNDGTGKMTAVANPRQPAFSPRAIVLRDFDGDGKLDLAVAYYQELSGDSSGRGTIGVLRGNGDGTFKNPVFLAGGRPISLETASLTVSGKLDLLAGYQSGSLLLFPGNGNGTFQSSVPLPATNTTGIVVGDFTGSGRTDVVSFNGTANVEYLSNQPPVGPDLTLTKSHAGTLSAGQTGAAYSIVVSNIGQGASSGVVTVTENPPANLTITAMSGSGWTCSALPVCTRTDALPGGQAYPAITVMANIAAGAVSPRVNTLVNQASVSGGGDTNPKNNTGVDTAVLRDATPPVVVPQITGTLGGNGWYRSNATVSWSVTDPESGIASSSGCGPTTLTTDTAGVTLTCSAINGAGLSKSVAVSIKIDKTAPTISGMPVAGCKVPTNNNDNGNNDGGNLIKIATVTAADALSGLAPSSLKVTGTSNQPSDQPKQPQIVITPNGSGGFTVQVRADSSGNSSRVYTLTATASDLAGNAATVTGACTVPNPQGNNDGENH
ncbi:MAG: FG-GAP-like repeat-containing protein [Bryobacteraceae bacterium]